MLIFFLPVIMASGIAAVSNNDSLMGHAIHALSGDVSLTGDGDNTSMVKGLMDLLGASFSPANVLVCIEFGRQNIYHNNVLRSADLDFFGRLTRNFPVTLRGILYRRCHELGKLLENHIADDKPGCAGQQCLYDRRSIGRSFQCGDYGYV